MTQSLIISFILSLLITDYKNQENLEDFFASPIVKVEIIGENLSCFNYQLFKENYSLNKDSSLIYTLNECLPQAISNYRDISSLTFTKNDIDLFREASTPYLKDIIGEDLPKEQYNKYSEILENLEKKFRDNPKELLENYKNSYYETFEISVTTSKRINLENAKGELLEFESTHNLIRKPYDLPWTVIYNSDTLQVFNFSISDCFQEAINLNMFEYNADKVGLMLEILELELAKK